MAGRRVRPDRVGFESHLRRPEHDGKHPVHLTAHRVADGPSFREKAVLAAISEQLKLVNGQRAVKVLHSKIEEDTLHFYVEGKNLGIELRFVFARIAMAVNRAVGRRGQIFRDRYHREDLTTPADVKKALRFFQGA